jgi:hypothetical protein
VSEALPPPADETVAAEIRDDRLCDRFEFLLLAGRPASVPEFLRNEGIDLETASANVIRELTRLAAYYRPGR